LKPDYIYIPFAPLVLPPLNQGRVSKPKEWAFFQLFQHLDIELGGWGHNRL
jgi:hypothetical protein